LGGKKATPFQDVSDIHGGAHLPIIDFSVALDRGEVCEGAKGCWRTSGERWFDSGFDD
jgi:hypothetical protein